MRPILVVLTLPVTLVTLGLFLFVINALMFWAASGLLSFQMGRWMGLSGSKSKDVALDAGMFLE